MRRSTVLSLHRQLVFLGPGVASVQLKISTFKYRPKSFSIKINYSLEEFYNLGPRQGFLTKEEECSVQVTSLY